MSGNNQVAASAEVTSNKTIAGVVKKCKMNKTVVVVVERKVKHELYGKYIRRISKMYVHDENNSSREGDVVLIEQCRPLSKLKRWKLKEILKREEQE